MTSIAMLGPLAALTAALNVSLGRPRAGAGRRSRRRVGLLAASALLCLALRQAFGLELPEVGLLLAAMAAGQSLGRRTADMRTEPSPLRWRVAAYGAILGGLMLMAGAPAHGEGSKWERLDADEPAPAFSLTDQNGRRVALADFHGKVAILTFMYTECRDICPALPQIINRADQELTAQEREKVRFVGISLDPNRDTPEKLRGFMQQHNLSSERWTLLTGSLKEATRAADDYGIVAKPDVMGDLVHNAVYILIDPKGHLRHEFHGLFSPTQEIVKALRGLIAAKSPANKKG